MSQEVLDCDIRYIKGVGQQRAGLFAKLGVFSLRDLISHFPRDYEDRSRELSISALTPGETVCVRAIVAEDCHLAHIRAGLDIIKTRAVDETGSLALTFFNQRYVKMALKRGLEYVFYGRVTGFPGHLEMQNPVFEPAGAAGVVTGRIVPSYPLCAGISNGMMIKIMEQALKEAAGSEPDLVPPGIAAAYTLESAGDAYREIHFPGSWQALAQARRRLVFEELFLLALGLARMKEKNGEHPGIQFENLETEEFCASLPFALTASQRRALSEAAADMGSGRAMNRLIQGDVGSGKTVVAAACAFLAVRNGFQAAMMAPTSILAEQHFKTLSGLLAPFGVRTLLLTGDGRGKSEKLEAIASGEADLIIGTHAVISERVEFSKLSLVITDEQHRFGVRQRAELLKKGRAGAHLLVMSATPIPRTLALIFYGDLDVSVMDELPPGRQKIDTFVVGENIRARIEQFVRKLVSEGRQAYIVCPLVEDDGDDDKKAVESYARTLSQRVYPDLRVGHMHGRMKQSQKEAVMRAFCQGQTDILVSTTVIEVGVDVPNATLMIVENAERYGLSQLHQLRGRVGRGKHKSYCVLFLQTDGQAAKERLEVLARTGDGFEIADADLRQRGPGDFFGSRQHGLPRLRVASLSDDVELMGKARQAACALIAEDPGLEAYPLLRRELGRMFSLAEGTLN